MPRSPPTPPGRAPKSASSRTPRPPCRLQCHSPHRRFLARRAPPPASLLLDFLPQSLFFLASSVRRSNPTLGTRLPHLNHRLPSSQGSTRPRRPLSNRGVRRRRRRRAILAHAPAQLAARRRPPRHPAEFRRLPWST